MKIKIDENLPAELASTLGDLGHDVHTIPDEGLTAAPDEEIADAVVREHRFLITQDVEFADRRRWIARPGAGLMLVRIENDSRLKLVRCITGAFRENDVCAWERCQVVLTELKVRVHSLRSR